MSLFGEDEDDVVTKQTTKMKEPEPESDDIWDLGFDVSTDKETAKQEPAKQEEPKVKVSHDDIADGFFVDTNTKEEAAAAEEVTEELKPSDFAKPFIATTLAAATAAATKAADIAFVKKEEHKDVDTVVADTTTANEVEKPKKKVELPKIPAKTLKIAGLSVLGIALLSVIGIAGYKYMQNRPAAEETAKEEVKQETVATPAASIPASAPAVQTLPTPEPTQATATPVPVPAQAQPKPVQNIPVMSPPPPPPTFVGGGNSGGMVYIDPAGSIKPQKAPAANKPATAKNDDVDEDTLKGLQLLAK